MFHFIHNLHSVRDPGILMGDWVLINLLLSVSVYMSGIIYLTEKLRSDKVYISTGASCAKIFPGTLFPKSFILLVMIKFKDIGNSV